MTARPYIIKSIEFGADATVLRIEHPPIGDEKYATGININVTAEHGRALSQYLGEEVQLFAVPACTTFDNVFKFKVRPQ